MRESMTRGAVEFVREAPWLNSSRVRGYAVLVGIASIALLAASWVRAQGPLGSDFLAFWGAAQAVLAGRPEAAFDLHFQQQVQTGAGFTGWYAFVNPPPFLFAVAPFGALPVSLAWLAWVVVTYAIWAWVSIRAFPRLWPLVLVFPGALIAAGHAQNGFVTGALLVAGVALLERRPATAGALLGALVVKPHLALLVPFWLAAGGRWRAFSAAAACALGLLALSWATFGTATMTGYITSWQASAAIMRAGNSEFFLKMATLYAQLRLYAGAAVASAAAALLIVAMIALVIASWRRFGEDAVATGSAMLAATALASPYLFSYDLPFLILPLLWLVHEGLRHGFRPWEKALLVLLWLAPYATRAAALPLGLDLMPLASALLLWLVWQRGAGRAANRQESVPLTS
ncbi:MAG TPA: glycosyltransferase family 87 protein [Croceibacterium sp.]|nr:glycosyltransferase family 87 protein [Croceibacterium sp.]